METVMAEARNLVDGRLLRRRRVERLERLINVVIVDWDGHDTSGIRLGVYPFILLKSMDMLPTWGDGGK
jgi:hypothetical protein